MKPARKKADDARAAYEAWYDEQVRLGLEDLAAGRVVSDTEATEHMRLLREKLRSADALARAA